MEATVLGVGLLVLLGVAGMVIGIIALALNESTRSIGLTLGVVMLAMVGVVFMGALLFVRRHAPVAQSVPTQIPVRAVPQQLNVTVDPVLPEQPLPPPALEASNPPAEGPLETAAPTPASAAVDKPAWLDQPGQLQGTVYRTSVKSGLFVTRAECNEALVPKIEAAIASYIDDYLSAGAAAQVKIDAALVKQVRKGDFEEAVTSATVGPMKQVHTLLEFDDATRSELSQRWHQTLVNRRLVLVTLAGGLVLGLLGVAAGYLKLDLLSAGQHRGWLKLAAGAAILLLVTAVVAVIG